MTSSTPNKWKPDKRSKEKEMTEDELLDSLLEAKDICGMKGCKSRVTLMGLVCQFCHFKYCFKHANGAFHGCEEQAKKAARGAFKAKYTQPPPLNKAKRGAAKSQLQSKLSDLKSSRKKTTKKK